MNNDRNPSNYVIGPDAVIEDANLDDRQVYYQGERLTEARAAELGEQAASEARKAWERHLIPGRKSLSGGRKHSPIVQFRVSESTRNRLEEIASARGITVLKLSRQVIDELVERGSATG